MTAEETSLQLKCDQCNYTNATEKGLRQHWRMRHRISQVDGIDDSNEDNTKDTDIVTLELDDTGE